MVFRFIILAECHGCGFVFAATVAVVTESLLARPLRPMQCLSWGWCSRYSTTVKLTTQ
jgi:hypothetical protein